MRYSGSELCGEWCNTFVVSYPRHPLSLSRATRCEGDLNRISNVGLVDATMNKRTLTLNTLQVFVNITTENLLYLAVVESCAQATGETFGASWVAGTGCFYDCLQCPLHHRAGKTNRTRGFGI